MRTCRWRQCGKLLDVIALAVVIVALFGACRYMPDQPSRQVEPGKGHDEDWPALDPGSVSVQKLADHLAALTNPEMRGRNVLDNSLPDENASPKVPPFPSLAAQYVAEVFSSANLGAPAVVCTSLRSKSESEKSPDAPATKEETAAFMQPFDLVLRSLEKNQRLTVVVTAEKETRRLALRLGEDYIPMQFGAAGTFSAPIFFAGYGISATDLYYDDYRGHDVRDKVVLVLSGLPGGVAFCAAGENLAPQNTPCCGEIPYASIVYKAMNAKRHGARGILLVVEPTESAASGTPPHGVKNHGQDAHATDASERLRELGAWPSHLPARLKKKSEGEDSIRHNQTPDTLALGVQVFAGKLCEETEGARPALFVRPDALQAEKDAASLVVFALAAQAADSVLAQAGTSVAAAKDQIDRSQQPASVDLAGISVVLECGISARAWMGLNVVGVVMPRPDVENPEWIVVGAHYDHLGVGGDGRAFPGANDNASGVAVLLELARGLSHFAGKLKRGIVLCAFDAEERGLSGSTHFARSLAASDRIVAMLNLDMVGRKNAPQQQSSLGEKNLPQQQGLAGESAGVLRVIGASRSPELCQIVGEALAGENFEVKSDIEFAFLRGSDHWPFHCAGIPALQVTTGRFPEMHTVDDTPDKVSVELLEKVARAVRKAVLEIAEREGRFPAPKHVKTEYPK